MIGTIELLIGLLLAVAGLALLAHKLRLAYPILLVLGGLVLGFVPGLPRLQLNPDLIFVLFLPPLLYPAAFFTSWRDFHANLGPILRLAIGLVLLTTVAVAWFAHQFMGFPLAAAFVLGAIISPPDAVAATAVTQNLRIPHRIITILDGESLVNDATSFTTYHFAVAAVLTGLFSMGEASAQFVGVVIGGIAVGVGLGWLTTEVQRRLDDPPVQTTLSLLTPYVIYLAAEALKVSGVLAVVVAGLYVGWRSPEVFNSRMRMVARSVWGMVVFILNGFIFILIGLQLPDVVHGISRHSLADAIGLAALVVVLITVVRFLWFFAAIYIPRALGRVSHRSVIVPSWRHLAIMSWAGMRGVDSLAAALALPMVTLKGEPFPQRAMIVFLTFGVILGTLVVQGMSLPWLIRCLKIEDDTSLEEEERQARLQANQAGLQKLMEIAQSRTIEQSLLLRLRAEYEDRIQQLGEPEAGEPSGKLSLFSADYESLLREILTEERRTILRLRNDRIINDNVLRRIQRDIDLAEARLQQDNDDFGM